jgi:hypothetical protein
MSVCVSVSLCGCPYLASSHSFHTQCDIETLCVHLNFLKYTHSLNEREKYTHTLNERQGQTHTHTHTNTQVHVACVHT